MYKSYPIFIILNIHHSIIYLFSTYYVPRTLLGTRTVVLTKKHMIPTILDHTIQLYKKKEVISRLLKVLGKLSLGDGIQTKSQVIREDKHVFERKIFQGEAKYLKRGNILTYRYFVYIQHREIYTKVLMVVTQTGKIINVQLSSFLLTCIFQLSTKTCIIFIIKKCIFNFKGLSWIGKYKIEWHLLFTSQKIYLARILQD